MFIILSSLSLPFFRCRVEACSTNFLREVWSPRRDHAFVGPADELRDQNHLLSDSEGVGDIAAVFRHDSFEIRQVFFDFE